MLGDIIIRNRKKTMLCAPSCLPCPAFTPWVRKRRRKKELPVFQHERQNKTLNPMYMYDHDLHLHHEIKKNGKKKKGWYVSIIPSCLQIKEVGPIW